MKFSWSLIAVSLVAASSLHALSFQEGMDETLSTNPIIVERLNNYRATLEDIRAAEAGYLPSLDWISSIGWEKTKTPSTGFQTRTKDFYEHSLQLTENLFNGFGTEKMVDYHRARLFAASNHFVEKTNDVALTYTQAYINVLKAKALLDISADNVKFNEDIYTKVNKLYEAGLTTRSEAEKSDTSYSLAKSNFVVAQNNLADALYNFQRVYGHPVKASELEDIALAPVIPQSPEAVIQYALEHNPSIMVSKYNVKAACILHEQRKSAYYPKVDAIVRGSQNNNVNGIDGTENRFRAGLTLSYNLYRGGADEAEVQKRLSNIHQEQQTKRDKERELIEQSELSWSAHNYTTQQLEYLTRYKATSEKTLELYQKEYDLGRRTLLDLLVAQNDYISAKQQILRAKYDNLFAKYRVLDAMGSMVHSVLKDRTADHTALVALKPQDIAPNKDNDFGYLFLNRSTIERQADDDQFMTRTLVKQ